MTGDLPEPPDGCVWTNAVDLAVGDVIWGGDMDGELVTFAVVATVAKPKTVWLTIDANHGSHYVGRQQFRPRRDDQYPVIPGE